MEATGRVCLVEAAETGGGRVREEGGGGSLGSEEALEETKGGCAEAAEGGGTAEASVEGERVCCCCCCEETVAGSFGWAKITLETCRRWAAHGRAVKACGGGEATPCWGNTADREVAPFSLEVAVGEGGCAGES